MKNSNDVSKQGNGVEQTACQSTGAKLGQGGEVSQVDTGDLNRTPLQWAMRQLHMRYDLVILFEQQTIQGFVARTADGVLEFSGGRCVKDRLKKL